MKNLLVAQSGGPTAAINATLAGVIEASVISSQVDLVLGGVNGIKGILQENFIDLKEIFKNSMELDILSQTPASFLGSCRYKLKDLDKSHEEYEKLVNIFRKHSISYFIYIGGNDSMDTVKKLSRYLKEKNIDDITVVGAPKTIDNDLVITDHCPGYGSASKYIASTIKELKRDINVYDIKSVTIVEIMGRNAGWLTAASALSRLGDIYSGPDSIYLCENYFDDTEFLKETEKIVSERNSVLIAVSEGLKYKNNSYVSEETQTDTCDSFGHKYISGTARILENLIQKNFDYKTRSIELNLMQRCSSHILSLTDVIESKSLGQKAVNCALGGLNGHMSIINRLSSSPYQVSYSSVEAEKVANFEKKIPLDWITETDVKSELMEYMEPLIQGEKNIIFENGLPKHISRLSKFSR